MRRRPWIWIVGGTLLVVLACGGFYLSRQVGDPTRWPREVEAWNLRHALPEEDNAEPVYARLAGLHGTSPPWRWGASKDWSLTDPMLPSVEGQEENLRLLAEASRKPACFQRFHPELPINRQPVVHLNRIQQGANLLALDARRKAGEGRRDEALDSLMTEARIGFQLRQTLIDQLVGNAVRNMAWPCLERLTMDSPPSIDALERAAREIGEMAARRPSIQETLDTERLVGFGMLESSYTPAGFAKLAAERAQDSGRSGPAWHESGPLPWAREACLHPLRRTREELEETYRLLSKGSLTKADKDRLDRISQGSLLLGETAQAFMKTRESTQRELACERGTRILLRLRAHRLRKGAYPETLAGLGRALPDDPYTGKPFVYRRLEGDKFLLYSTGPDGKDDGGATDSRDFPLFPKGADMLFGRPPQP